MIRLLTTAVLLAWAFPNALQAQIVWIGTNGVSATTNWSDVSNWDLGVAPTGYQVQFFDSGSVGDVVTINNVVDANLTVAGLAYGQTNGIHNTLVPGGVTLTVSDLTTLPLRAGTETFGTTYQVTNTISGAGILQLESPGQNIQVRQCGPANTALAILDLSGLNTFSNSVKGINIGESTSTTFTRAAGKLTLAKTNFITLNANSTTTSLLVGSSDANAGGNSTLELGQSNVVNCGGITIGRNKQTGALIRFAPGLVSPVAVFRHTNGVDRLGEIRLGDANTSASSASASGTMDFTGGTVDILVDQIKLGRASTATNFTQFTSRGTLTFDAGLIDVNILYIGQQSASTYRSAIGELNVNGSAKLVVNTSLFVAYASGGPGITNTSGTLNINGGTVVAPSILQRSVAGATCTNTVTVNGGTVIVTNGTGSIGSASLPIQTLNLTNATLTLAGVPSRVFVNALAVGGTTNKINISHFTNAITYPFQIPLLGYTNPTGNLNLVGLGTLPSGYTGYISNNAPVKSLDLVLIDPNPLPSTPTNLTFSVSSGDLTVSWPVSYIGWILEQQTNSLATGLSTNWVTVPGSTGVSTMNFPLDAAPVQFFRMRKP